MSFKHGDPVIVNGETGDIIDIINDLCIIFHPESNKSTIVDINDVVLNQKQLNKEKLNSTLGIEDET